MEGKKKTGRERGQRGKWSASSSSSFSSFVGGRQKSEETRESKQVKKYSKKSREVKKVKKKSYPGHVHSVVRANTPIQINRFSSLLTIYMSRCFFPEQPRPKLSSRHVKDSCVRDSSRVGMTFWFTLIWDPKLRQDDLKEETVFFSSFGRCRSSSS